MVGSYTSTPLDTLSLLGILGRGKAILRWRCRAVSTCTHYTHRLTHYTQVALSPHQHQHTSSLVPLNLTPPPSQSQSLGMPVSLLHTPENLSQHEELTISILQDGCDADLHMDIGVESKCKIVIPV